MTPEAAIRAIWLAWWASWLAAAAWSDRAVKRPATQNQITYRLLAALGTVLLFGFLRGNVDEMPLWRTPTALAWTLAAVVVAGLLFTWWARIHLGRLWSSSVTRKADHHVVDTGPYGIVRHPIYTGIILASCATAAMRGTALAWLGACVMTVGWVIKARLEEAFLREQLGEEAYGEYSRRVPMLVPAGKAPLERSGSRRSRR
ncbi:MAG TPA: isoprenylcysteine carboxylmethyltransferase family protein [Vicinamibacterales bacterium]|nr:isoprenylcysteine carboxylmethyltransferase family protein [Vicinamibacterales bacterium]